ncbi:MAG: mutarotase [Gracilimonas sp.]|uniref:2'-5' RNA ligase family protein n=1 Tax=Gracilimonas sp. TaxID=1974203 RepID=UPI0019B3D79A|nr:hypothetical protein [Gracilimonas sp.]MBD3615210.1 mutarotase [Gracilimonas sp.]
MNLKKHYNQLWDHSVQKFESGNEETDPLIDDVNDTRYGLTLLARPSVEVKHAISKIQEEIKLVAPEQYYYPVSDIHITVLSIISCEASFGLSQIDLREYTNLIKSVLDKASPFEISFRGLTASPSAIMVCGFPANDTLNDIRDSLRKAFKKSSIEHTIDKRYLLQTAHITTMRFRNKLKHSSLFIKKIQALNEQLIGSSTIHSLELVGNDWYQREAKTELIKKFQL